MSSSNSSYNVHGAVGARAAPLKTQFQFGPWTLTAVRSHILESEGQARTSFEGQLELPQVPEMIFADNVLRIQHSDGYAIEFSALEALKGVDAHHDNLKVAVADAWKEARADCEHINEVVKPFDWTFTSAYKGTLTGTKTFQTEITEERIDMEKLKVREKIHYYEDIVLFEDELSDNGSSIMNVKIRVMPSSYFVLLRQYVRVDDVVVRVLDTRLYHEAGKNYILREHSCKESKTKDLQAPAHVLNDVNEVAQLLPTQNEVFEKLLLSSGTSTSEANDCVR